MNVSIADLRPLPGLQSFTDDELGLLLGVAQLTRTPATMVLCREGELGASCFLVIAGQLEILRGDDERLGLAAPGAFIGQIALVDRGRRSATVRARVDSVLLELSRDVFETLLRARSPVALRFQELIAVTGIRQQRAAIARLSALAERHPELAAPPSKEALGFVRAAAGEWGLSFDEIDAVEVVASQEPRPSKRPGY